MKSILAVAVALGAFAILADASDAQVNGYRFGVGVCQANGLLFRGFSEPREQPPFFAKFPPVYYNDIVPRNYGSSPFAAPAGIMPVEGIGEAAKPTRIVNEFYQEPDSASAKPEKRNADGQVETRASVFSSRRIVNPYAIQRIADK